MNNRIDKTEAVLRLLDEHYPRDMKCFLEYSEPWQLLMSTIMSAQCTDARVNIVARELYTKYPTLELLAAADDKELEGIVKPTGFFRNKSKNIKECAVLLLKRHGGVVPRSIEELTALPGVGRKTANVIRSHIYSEPSIVVDTHVKRVSRKLGFTDTDDPVKAEFRLMEILPREHWIAYNQQIISHGRAICISGRPKCAECFLKDYCDGRG